MTNYQLTTPDRETRDCGVIRLSGQLRGFTTDQIWVVDGKISHTPPAAGSSKEITGFIYPGLVDAHTHPGLSYTPELLDDAEVHRRLRACVALGVTAIRDCGGQCDAGQIRTEAEPRVIYCGQHIARFKRYIRNAGIDTEPHDLVRQVRQQCEKANGWIKIVGDWINRDKGEFSDLEPLWPRETIIAAVRAAHDLNTKVTVHTFAHETIDDLLDAGVDGIEHGTGMDWDQLVRAREQGVLITPTVNQISRFPEFAADAGKYPVYARRMLDMDARRREHLAMMVQAQTHFLMGSDTSADVDRRGLPTELCDAVRNGIPAHVVMDAASYGGRRRLGLTSWEDGAVADFVVYDRDPEQDISAVLSPSYVLIGGRIVAHR
ncbi:imidazolonepropionase-like amidohydrolase [Arcanobacterium pluranimalium]|uniref:amidohydrolase family protein n=1 Tax=Arcanobacterium pluranimalium TaxID=108028 RepID=UPI00195B4316|nr:amidohydrolase family protein [Arcanobacterium pluranimalium]MBM7825675.1 imidazolonepropionase-like amidohydrolase [Arcanobacterium pluranimalium]